MAIEGVVELRTSTTADGDSLSESTLPLIAPRQKQEDMGLRAVAKAVLPLLMENDVERLIAGDLGAPPI